MQGNETRCFNMFKIEKNVFIKLINKLQLCYGLQVSRRMSALEMVGIFVNMSVYDVKKWKIIKSMPSYPYNKQVKIVVATMALHNFIRRNITQYTEFETSDTHDPEDADGIQDVQSEATCISESAT
ncbi:hypothetical protein CFOL_v3_23064 [Cephalotus follicularis]|uniref:DUF8040 domain-containing protein n=1 Tax=Cephalotus follicularis TaxID=3775 RepID=A0A1Q3CHA8_CEPFO|nr:hypothetical protein CFOL_v3_23064 [Cephalotus follicularis]